MSQVYWKQVVETCFQVIEVAARLSMAVCRFTLGFRAVVLCKNARRRTMSHHLAEVLAGLHVHAAVDACQFDHAIR